MKLAKPTSVTRVAPELDKLLGELSDDMGISRIDAGRILARQVQTRMKEKGKLRFDFL
jgi:hypothetical protein